MLARIASYPASRLHKSLIWRWNRDQAKDAAVGFTELAAASAGAYRNSATASPIYSDSHKFDIFQSAQEITKDERRLVLRTDLSGPASGQISIRNKVYGIMHRKRRQEH